MKPMPKKYRLSLAACALALLPAFLPALVSAQRAAQAPQAQPKFPPKLPDVAKEGYAKQYVQAPKNKAFVVSADGQRFSAVYGLSTPDEAARTASSACLAEHKTPCQLWLVNDSEMFGSYAKAARQSAELIAQLPASLDGKLFADEAVDHQIAAPKALHPGTEMHGATPLAGPEGSFTISTDALVKLYKAEKRLVVLDVLHSKTLNRQTLPKASWIYGAGWEQAEVNKMIGSQFQHAMRTLAPRKDTPIVSYCSNRDCWLSWNTALRLRQAGYKKVYWYRGGIEAWRAANLPLVETPLYAHMW